VPPELAAAAVGAVVVSAGVEAVVAVAEPV
jgi:hypothetical protein